MPEYKRITGLVIDRSRWLRGLGPDEGVLLGGERMCCLGFACVAAGVPVEDLRGRQMPSDLGRALPDLSYDGEFDQWQDTMLSEEASAINDDKEIDDATREAKLIALFAAQDPPIALTFVDGEPKP